MHLFKSNNYRVESSFKFDRRHLNFYGLFTDYDWTNIPSFRSSLIDAEQNLNYLKIKSNWEWFNSILKKIDFDTMLTIDYFDNTEQLINLNSEIRLPVFDFFLELKPNFSYVNTNFVSSFIYETPLTKQTSLLNLDFQLPQDLFGRQTKRQYLVLLLEQILLNILKLNKQFFRY